MDNSGDVGDDQGSGWLQVKKKHRISSKSSAQKWVGGSLRKNAGEKSAHSRVKHDSHLSKSGKDDATVGGKVAGKSSVSKNEKVEHCLDKCVVIEGNVRVSQPLLKTQTIMDTDSISIGNKGTYQKEPDAIHKIKCCDTEGDSLQLPLGSAAASGIKFGKIGDADLAICAKLCDSSCAPSDIDKDVVKVTDTVCDQQQDTTLSPVDGILNRNSDEVSAVTFSGVEILGNPTYDSPHLVKSPEDDFSPENDAKFDCNSKQSRDEYSCPINEEAAPPEEDNALDVTCLSENRNTGEGLNTSVSTDDSELASSEKNVLKNPQDTNITDIIEDWVAVDTDSRQPDLPTANKDYQGVCSGNQSNLSKAEIMSSLGKREEGESKERFRERLWRFLFENLNRAVDELYLLCELECDLEQVKEAILVLEEGGSDFRELNCRILEFEELKKSISQPKEGTSMAMKSDHRRPHALSWEVRRMTTSPHRAEILSSSLEAFKKIQEERALNSAVRNLKNMGSERYSRKTMPVPLNIQNKSTVPDVTENKSRRQSSMSDLAQTSTYRERKNQESTRSAKVGMLRNVRRPSSVSSFNFDVNSTNLPPKGSSAAPNEPVGSVDGLEKGFNSRDDRERQNAVNEKEKERRNSLSWKSMNAWKEKRNWEEILALPFRVPSRMSHSPGMSRKSAERARILHVKLMSPEKKKKNALDLKKEAEEKHARATRIRNELENEKVQKLQRSSEKLNRVNEFQAVRSMKLRECMNARQQRSESRHEAYIAQVVKRAGDESIKVNEVRFITSLNEESKKFMIRQKQHDSEMRRAEKLQVLKTKQKEDIAREEAVLERRRLLEAEKLQRLAEIQRRKEEALVRREEERKASSAAREARAIEQCRRREERAKAQQEEAELLAQRLAERLSESEQRRKFYLEQIRERASMDFRDQSSPLLRRSFFKDGQGKSTSSSGGEDNGTGALDSRHASGEGVQHSLKRRIKKIRQRLMALKHEVPEPIVAENSGIGYRTAVATARAKIGRWLQDLQRHRQQRKEGASSIGLITAEMIKVLDGKELELQASRQAGLLDFISAALPASYISKPEACQVTVYFLRLLKVLLSVPTNRSHFLAQNLLPPLIPMLSAALENYIKIAASINGPGSSNLPTSKTSSESFDVISEILDGFLWTISIIIGHQASDERQVQMHSGLQELVVSYQIIHHLRDLFTLYDRPQTEGSPFPSSILLSINLLVSLTSKPQSPSIIDWEPVVTDAVAENEDAVPSLDSNSTSLPIHDSVNESDPPSDPSDGFGAPHSPKDQESVEPINMGTVDSKSAGFNRAVYVSGGGMGTNDIYVSSKNLSSACQKPPAPLKDEKHGVYIGAERKDITYPLKSRQRILLSAFSETGLVSLPSLLTAVLLQANNRLSSEQGLYVLPSNFEEVATGVLKVLNNVALMDLAFVQRMLARPDLKIEFFHIMSFLVTHCTNNWKTASDQIGLLLLQSLFLLGHFSIFHSCNQAVLRWGKGSTILHKVCDLPFVFFSDPELMPVLAGTLVAACYGSEQNKGVVQQELSTEMLISLVKSCKSKSPPSRSSIFPDTYSAEDIRDGSLQVSEPRKAIVDFGVRATRLSAKSSRNQSSGLGSRVKNIKLRSQGSKVNRASEEASTKQKTSPEAMTLHVRFPRKFIDKVEEYFAAELEE